MKMTDIEHVNMSDTNSRQSSIRRVLADADWREAKAGVQASSNVEFLAVEADKIHIWIGNSHYVGVGEVDSIQEGDVFYEAGSYGVETLEYVYQISNIESATHVEVEFLYPPEKESMCMGEENILHGSPVLLTEAGYALLDSPERARTRDS